MNDYIQVDFQQQPLNEIELDILDALLCDIGFESFVQNDKGVSAFIKHEHYNSEKISEVVDSYPFTCKFDWKSNFIEGKDWNEQWEKNFFKPMVIANKCVIHSSFHTDYPKMQYDVVIDPKMAFGTGHHSTTNLIVTELLSMNLDNQKILDMGTGTGILSIISVMHGAANAVGVEIDEAAFLNALENIELNDVKKHITIIRGDASCLDNYEDCEFDIVLANINKNVILSDINHYARMLKKDGIMLLSGFYIEEVSMIKQAGIANSLEYLFVKEDNKWAMVCLKKN
ncbi:MAG: 50S ribosomal protein L11 methyltransferase [Bacteroidales bacterium]|nr:50S ribosomal protein L11 methyltransferase [Bacteroidales bacterium]